MAIRSKPNHGSGFFLVYLLWSSCDVIVLEQVKKLRQSIKFHKAQGRKWAATGATPQVCDSTTPCYNLHGPTFCFGRIHMLAVKLTWQMISSACNDDRICYPHKRSEPSYGSEQRRQKRPLWCVIPPPAAMRTGNDRNCVP